MTATHAAPTQTLSVPHLRNQTWINWAKTEHCRPDYLVRASTLEDLIAVIRFARENGKHIRAVSTGHSWSALVPTDEILVDVQTMNRVALDLSNPDDPRVTMDCGATVKEVNTVLESAGYALPFNVVLESVRFGGMIATGSHGSGWDNQTLSDLVWAIEIVDSSGQLRRFETGKDSPEVMNAARLNLGMFGLIYRMTLHVQPTWRVRATDRRVPIAEAMDKLPEWVNTYDNIDFFWWPFTKRFWIKHWSRTDEPITARPRYNRLETLRSLAEMRVYQPTLALLRHVPQLTPTIVPATFPFSPSNRDEVVDVVEAIHYRRGIELTRMGCLEVAFKVDRDFSNVRAAIQLVLDRTRAYADRGEYPLNVTLNVRFVHNSDCMLSPAYGAGHTCYIEILSHTAQPKWFQFSGEVAAEWLKLPQAMPHWAKEYRHIPNVIEHIKRVKGADIAQFKQIKTDLGVDPDQMFVNPTLREVFG